MAGSFAKLVVSLGANISSFETDMKRAATLSKRELAKMERDAEKLNATWNRNFKLAGAAVVAGLAAATKSAIDFQKAMGEVATLGTGNIDKLSESVKDLSVEFGQAPVEQARALYQIISAGAEDSATQLEYLTASNKLAVGGITDVATAADGLTTVLNAYAGTGLDAERATDVLFATMKGGKTTIGQLSSSIGVVASTAAQVGVSMEELGASISTVTKATGSTERTMTGLRAVFNAVIAQTEQTQGAAKELGVSFDIAGRGADGFKKLLQDIAASGATNEQLKRLFGSTEALSAVLPLLANDAQEFGRQLDNTANAAGAASEAVAEMADTTAFKVSQATAAFEVLRVEIGERFLSAVSGLASGIAENIDKIQIAVESLAAVIIARVGVAITASFLKAAAAGRTLATVMAFAGGPVGLLATGVALLVVNWDNLLARQDGLGNFVRQLDRGFTILWGVIKAVAYELGNLVQIALDVFDLVAAPISAIITSLGLAAQALSEGRLIDAGKALGDVLEKSGQRSSAALARLKENVDDIGKGAEFMADAWRRSAREVTYSAEEMDDILSEVIVTAKRIDGPFQKAGKSMATFADRTQDAAKRLKEINKILGEAFAILDITVESNPFAGLGKAIGEFVDEVNDGVDPLKDMKRAAEDLIDSLNPGQAAVNRFARELVLLEDYADATGQTAEWLAGQMELLAEKFYSTASGVDLLSVAMDEAARVLERTFSDIFTGIVNDSLDAWGAIESGFKSLVTTIAQNPIRVVVADIQKAFGPGGGGFGSLDLTKLGQGLVEAAGTILGLGSADSLFGQVGASLGQIFGKSLFSTLLPNVFSALGSWAGPIGTALGSILGSIVGDLVGGLFERKLAFTLGGENQRTRGDNQQIRTPLGDILGLSGQGNFGSLNDPSTLGGQLAKALTEFDTQIADFLKDFASDEQFLSVTESLKNWTASFGEGADAADVLASRFRVILGNFSGDIQAFVNGAADFEEQLNRFGVALTADKLLRENPELFNGRTTGELLNVISAFQSGAETMEDAFQEFLTLFSRVAAVSESLRAYADSDLLSDFNSLGGLSLTDALAQVNSQLMDAVATFDGSIESFEQIGALAMLAREGEIKLLQEIDAIQKGINSNLDKLKTDILGISAPDATGEQLFLDAQKLIAQITDQSSAADLAALERQFDSIIRSIAPEDQAFMQSEILALIELFRGRSNEVLGLRSSEVIDNAQNMRDMIDGLLVRVGDPLDIIAASLEGANLQEVMSDGLGAIDESVQQIGPQVAAALAQGLSQVSFTINLDGGGLVTQ